jgi:hypothetical protein
MDQDNPMTLIFRCPPELATLLPAPVPAVQSLPEWFKSMPQKTFNRITQEEDQTVKRCPPFIDAMTYGFTIPLACDLRVENGAFSWDFDAPVDLVNNFLRSPISFHDVSQVIGTPYYEEDRLLIKFINFWTIEAPPGYSLLFTHPANRPDLPFTTLTGLVDSDFYVDNRVHFPAHWHDLDFSGVLPKGTPVAQCMPVKRESWVGRVETQSDEQAARTRAMTQKMVMETNLYRREFRARKR